MKIAQTQKIIESAKYVDRSRKEHAKIDTSRHFILTQLRNVFKDEMAKRRHQIEVDAAVMIQRLARKVVRRLMVQKQFLRSQALLLQNQACVTIQRVHRGKMVLWNRIPRLWNLGGMQNIHRISTLYANALVSTAMAAIAKAAVDHFWQEDSTICWQDHCTIPRWGLSKHRASFTNCRIEVQRMIAPQGQHQGKFDTPPCLSYRLKLVVCCSSGHGPESLVNDRGDVVISYPNVLSHVGHLVDAIELQRLWSAFQARVLSRPGFPFEALEKHFVSQTLVRAISFDPQNGALHIDGKMVLNYMRSHLAWTGIEDAALLSAASALCPTHEVQRFSHLWVSEFMANLITLNVSR